VFSIALVSELIRLTIFPISAEAAVDVEDLVVESGEGVATTSLFSNAFS
jgi:hypothetical protein